MNSLIEETLLNSVRKLLSGRVNEVLGELEELIPPIEFGTAWRGRGYATATAIRLASCERTEKERIIRLDAYSLTITFTVSDGPEAERHCYAYAGAAAKALGEDTSLLGTVDRAVLVGKKYEPPKHPGTGEDWEVILTLRITVEGEE
jgi:hypothetical protein